MKSLSSKYNNRALGLVLILMVAITSGCNSSSKGDASTSPDADKLTIISTSPSKGDKEVSINSSVTATFSEKMNENTLNTESFTLQGADEPAIVGTVSLDAAGSTATFKPTSNLTASIVYTATLTTAVKGASGKALEKAHIWTFTSGATEDLTPPTVSSTEPATDDTDVSLNGSISALFSESLDPTTVSVTSFTLTEGTNAVAGTVTYVNKTINFKPSSNLAADTVYTATLTTALNDLAGNALAAEHKWSFTTGTTVATGPVAVNLLSAGDFVILSKAGITNSHTSAITGNIGASPITAAAMDTVFCTEITGIIYGSNAAYTGSGSDTCFKGEPADNTLVASAVLDMGTAYADAKGRTTPDYTELHAGDISGKTLLPGLYKWGTSVLINTDVTLDGNATDVWIFQIAGDVAQAANTMVVLTGGALAKNVFWQVAGGTGVTVGTGASFAGIVLAEAGISINTGASVNGRLFSHTAVTLMMNDITQP